MGIKILLVDDEPDIQQILSARLENVGYQAVSAENGEEALLLAKKDNPDVVLLDVMMPGMDGFEVCERLKQDDSQSKVVIYTAKMDGVDAARARQVGADDFTVKTSDFKYLLETIEKVLNSEEAH